MARRHKRTLWPRLVLAAATLALVGLAALTLIGHRQAAAMLDPASWIRPGAEPLPPGAPKPDPLLALGLPYVTRDVDAPFGIAPAWYRSGAEGAELAAIYVHGFGGSRADGLNVLPALHRLGIPVLLITYRNDGQAPQTGGGQTDLGETEWRDLDRAARVILADGPDKLVLIGSAGGAAVITAFLRNSDLADRVAGLALDAPALDYAATLTHRLRQNRAPWPSLAARLGLWALTVTHRIEIDWSGGLAVVAAFPGPVLLTQGTADQVIPHETVDTLAASRLGTTMVVRTEADHLRVWNGDRAEVEAAFTAFLLRLRI